jgi:hypothetical protein
LSQIQACMASSPFERAPHDRQRPARTPSRR